MDQSHAPEAGFTLLDRSTLLAQRPVPTEIIDVAELGGKVRLRGLTSTERDAWEASMAKEVPDKLRKGKTKWINDPQNLRAKLVVRCIIDKDGKRLLEDGDAEHLGKLPASIIERLFAVAKRLSAIDDDDVAEIEGNSNGDRSETSSAG